MMHCCGCWGVFGVRDSPAATAPMLEHDSDLARLARDSIDYYNNSALRFGLDQGLGGAGTGRDIELRQGPAALMLVMPDPPNGPTARGAYFLHPPASGAVRPTFGTPRQVPCGLPSGLHAKQLFGSEQKEIP
ncbi:ATP-dependent helicase brm [Frankliniella fusca]|uniref:ATP-dependent helicase brm n=1 Tax=Frankliniella fusca TaxID=407009 RepID=A0AAE1HAH4_9NEOP|nr:ATP-dependent helicase brm [Frankliniella fusca]